MRQIILIAHNLRSCHNVGSLLRTAEGLGVKTVILSGYTPYPEQTNDDRLPHLATKIDKQIAKTALGAQKSQAWQRITDLDTYITGLKADGWQVTAIEQAGNSQPLAEYKLPEKIALLVGREVEGVEPEVLNQMDTILEIPMFGKKESFNVVQAAAMALFYCRFF